MRTCCRRGGWRRSCSVPTSPPLRAERYCSQPGATSPSPRIAQRGRNTNSTFTAQTVTKPYDGIGGFPPPPGCDCSAVRPHQSPRPTRPGAAPPAPGSRWPHMGRDDCTAAVAAHPPLVRAEVKGDRGRDTRIESFAPDEAAAAPTRGCPQQPPDEFGASCWAHVQVFYSASGTAPIAGDFDRQPTPCRRAELRWSSGTIPRQSGSLWPHPLPAHRSESDGAVRARLSSSRRARISSSASGYAQP